jgi:membrane-bound hydrogenase subunit alpha
MPTVNIPIGPQHPALKEPAAFTLALEGERILSMELRLGYNHRGIEKACEERTYTQDVYLIERICGICSHAHSTAFVTAVEEVAGLQVPPRGLYIRTLIAELERVHSHLLWLGVAGHEIGFDTLLMYTWRDREKVMDILAMLTGNRVNYGINTIGGVRRDFTAEQLAETRKVMDVLEERTKYYIELAVSEPTLEKRLSKAGYLSHDDAVTLSALGPTARASNVDRDVRRDDPYLAYKDVTFKVITDDHCDVFGRTLVRVGELMQSYSIVRQLIDKMPDGPVVAKAKRKVPAGEAVTRYEAPRGEDVHYVKGNGTEKPERVKVRAPTLGNLASVAKMLEGNNLADFPIVIAAIDPCFSCTDRVIELCDAKRGRTDQLLWDDLRVRGIAWYRREAGIDFTKLNKALALR